MPVAHKDFTYEPSWVARCPLRPILELCLWSLNSFVIFVIALLEHTTPKIIACMIFHLLQHLVMKVLWGHKCKNLHQNVTIQYKNNLLGLKNKFVSSYMTPSPEKNYLTMNSHKQLDLLWRVEIGEKYVRTLHQASGCYKVEPFEECVTKMYSYFLC